MESSSIEIKLKRMDRVYRLSEKVEGVVIVNAYKGWNHTGVNVSIEGTIVLSHAGQTVGSLSDSGAKLITIMKKEASICAAGKFNEGATELPFEVVLSPLKGHNLLESYHGMYISIVYNIQVSCERGMLKKALRKEIEFIVETTSLNYTAEPNPIVFSVTPESLENISASVVATIPKFKITGKLHKSTCPVNRPLTGKLILYSLIINNVSS